jgi:site-specific DNA-methyltransferase (cytosine-N4-specific)
VILEQVRESIVKRGGRAVLVLLSLVSDLLREYSLQEPSDLRIRRRIAPLPTTPFLQALKKKATAFVCNLRAAQQVTGLLDIRCKANLGDSRRPLGASGDKSKRYDLVITSPPYATALPYIDTQRLSLIWLGLSSVEEIRPLEAFALGSREFNADSVHWRSKLNDNADGLPESLAALCRTMLDSLTEADGFRRRATPMLIYRYFTEMQLVFASLRNALNRGARLAFVVGSNQTTLGGQRFIIDTPNSLAIIAEQLGFRVSEVMPLETYQRYGLHQKNSINTESLTILEST